jgi:hypothetical protein
VSENHHDTSPAHALIDAFLAGDTDHAAALLAPDATFHSPVRDYAGRDRIEAVWSAVRGVIAGARTTAVHDAPQETAAFFTGAVGGRHLDGVLRVIPDAHGRPADVTLMVRPLSALKAAIAQIPPVAGG